MKKRVLIYGAGQNMRFHYQTLDSLYCIVGVIDGAEDKVGEMACGHRVEFAGDEILRKGKYDAIVVTPTENVDIINRLKTFGIQDDRIITISEMYDEAYKRDVLSIAVVFYGGMGDYLIGKNWLYHLIEKYNLQHEKWDVYIDDTAFQRGKEIFVDSEFIDSISPSSNLIQNEYDTVFHFCIVPHVQFFVGEALASKNIPFLRYVMRIKEYSYETYSVGFCHNPNYYRMIRRVMDEHPDKQYHNLCDLFDDLGIKDEFSFSLSLGDGEKLLKQQGLSNKPFITINTGLNKDYKGASCTRAWSYENWDKLARLIKEKYPDIIVVQVGEKMPDEYSITADVNLNGKTDIFEARALMKNALIHIDYEGGLIHVRHILQGGPSIVLFGPTNIKRHKYPENYSVYTGKCKTACEWTTDKWLSECPRGMTAPECMMSITPEMVMECLDEAMMELEEQRQ